MNLLFLDTFLIQGILPLLLFQDTFRILSDAKSTTQVGHYGKCLETGKQQNPLLAKNVLLTTLNMARVVTEFGKCQETGKQQNPLLSAKTSHSGDTE